MKNQQEFMEGLQDLIRIGKTNGNVLTQEEIRSFFEEYEIDDAQMSLVAAFMEENEIKIEGVEAAEEPDVVEEIRSEEEPSAVLKMYKEEIKELSASDDGEELRCLKAFAEGSTEAMNQLVEMNLSEVIAIAEKHSGQGVMQNDLIQEGNLALFLAITEYDLPEEAFTEEVRSVFHQFIMKKAEEAMTAYNEENAEATQAGRKLAKQTNKLNDLATEFAKKNEREAKPEELAEMMHITVDEVKDLMKLSLDAVNVLESGKGQDF